MTRVGLFVVGVGATVFVLIVLWLAGCFDLDESQAL